MELDVRGSPPTDQELADLEERASRLNRKLRNGNAEHKAPMVFEFSGSPKAGKTTIIGIVALFLRRTGFRLALPSEGASVETPPDLKDDLLAFNVWCGCYAIQNVLVRSHDGDPADILILDRGLFDWAAWIEYLATVDGSVDRADAERIQAFARLSAWYHRETAVFLFLADPKTALSRERRDQLTRRPGRAMNSDFLTGLQKCYRDAAAASPDQVPAVYVLDTSDLGDQTVKFQRVAYVVTKQILELVEQRVNQELLVTAPFSRRGFVRLDEESRLLLQQIADAPKFLVREAAEASFGVQQIVPYGFIENAEGRVLCARRRSEGERSELAGKRTMLFGGHAEKRDFDAGEAAGVFERCLRREIDEELIGLRVQSVEPIGLINDAKSKTGQKHLAVLHRVVVGGRAAIRRQTSDREFSRESVEWREKEEIAKEIDQFDPWSRLVAASVFGGRLPDADRTLFG